MDGAARGAWRRPGPATAPRSVPEVRPEPVDPARQPGSSVSGWVVLLAVLLSAANMRPAVAVVAPLLGRIEADAGLGAAGLLVLTAGPVLCFGILSPLVPVLVRRWGLGRTQAVALAVLAAASGLRALPGATPLLVGTVATGAGIAVLNVAVPVAVKRWFPGRSGAVTSAYTTVLGAAAAVAAWTALPLGDAVGWRGTVALWGIPAALAAAAWSWTDRGRPAEDAAARPREPGARLARDPVAWQVTGFLGLQSLLYYASLTWLPAVHESHGLSAAAAGGLHGLLMAVGIPAALVVPVLAARARRQVLFVVAVTAASTAGLAGMVLAPAASPTLWTVLLGVGLGGGFPLALTLVVLRARSVRDAADLSGMAQGVGFLLAATGPLGVGALHAATGSWRPGLVMLLVVAVLRRLGAGRARHVGARRRPSHPTRTLVPTARPLP